jgi:hypothetical protein
MRALVTAVAMGSLALVALGSAQSKHLNPMIDLLSAKKPVFGLYTPRAGRGAAPRPPADVAKEALAYEAGDILFSGDMERNFDAGYGNFSQLVPRRPTSTSAASSILASAPSSLSTSRAPKK